MFRCIDCVLALGFLVGFYASTGRYMDVEDPGFQMRALRSWTRILTSMSVMINWCWCQIILSAAELWRSQLYHELSKCWVFILVTLSGSSSPQPRTRLTPLRPPHPACWFPTPPVRCFPAFPILPPTSLNNLDWVRAFIQTSRWVVVFFLTLFSVVFHLKRTNHRLTCLVLSIAFKMAKFRLSRDDSTLRYSPRCWEK